VPAEPLKEKDQDPAEVTSTEPDLLETVPFTETIGPSEAIAGIAIGPYHLVQLIGRGGMGEVWLAEQKQPVRRRVAVKLIKAGMDTREVVARFESEKQALALMDHPSIAKVFDAGSTPLGRPYFVMEYVTGIPITTYCDQHKLGTRERLELFVKVCEGVQHAHQKAILHRDLKPSNILVTEVDGKPLPRIIDFGVAKATSQQLTADTLVTRLGAIVGTPGYMSPEQADSAGVDVDTRTDVYSLGVVLYKLLVGVLPLDFSGTPPEQIPRKLREEDAPRPSTKLRTLAGPNSNTIAETRGADRPTLVRQLRGDLDAITLKALEKDRSRRYATPVELAADIERYLRHEAVSARPASLAYRARKYIRRHRLGVGISAGAAVVLVSFAVAQRFELQQTRRERDRADRVTSFMTEMFKVSDPNKARGSDIRAREILDRASTQIGTELANQPELQAQMMDVMGTVYKNLGVFPKAESLLQRAVDIRRRLLGPRNPATLASMNTLGNVLQEESRFAESEKLLREAVDGRRQVLGAENRDTLASKSQLASLFNSEGRYPEAEKLNREALEVAKRVAGPSDPLTRNLLSNLGIDLAYEGKYEDAEKAFREALEVDRRTFGSDHPKVLGDMNNVGAILLQEEKYPDSERVYTAAIEAERRVLGPEHPQTTMSMGNLALVEKEERHYAEAEKLFRDTLDIKRRTLGPENRSTLVTAGNLAEILTREGKYSEAEPLARRTLEAERRILGPDHSDTLYTLDALGEVLKSEKKYVEAEQASRDAVDRRRRVLGADHPDSVGTAYHLARILALEGKRDQAIAQLQYAAPRESASGIEELAHDPEFESLRKDPRFDALVASRRAEIAAHPGAK
jgi:serine/threonine protein kinase/Tfp pilus assembly protein PilF